MGWPSVRIQHICGTKDDQEEQLPHDHITPTPTENIYIRVELSESKMDLWERYVDALRIKLSYHYELCFVERQNGRLFGETIKVLDTDVNDQVWLAPSIPA